MGDLNSRQADLPVGIIGLSTTGVVETPVGSDTNGNLLVKDYADGPVTPGAVAAASNLAGGQYNNTLPTLTSNQQVALQVDINGRLLVNVNTGTISVNILGLNNLQTSQYTIGTSAAQITPSPLSTRSSIGLKATTTSNSDAVFIGVSSAVTISNGYPLFNGDTVQLDITQTGTLWAIGTSAGQKVYAIEVGS